ncbi:MAG: hypothetical protein GXP54_04005, partial [Deltaproteobacteria bacterium]|nr:hypothetical protein [Deltaproteobacteria bacterium]
MKERTLLAMLALSLAACGGGAEATDNGPDKYDAVGGDIEDPAPVDVGEAHTPLTGAEVTAGGYTVRWDLANQELTLARGSDVLMSFPVAGFLLGRVDELEDNLSYDPWFLYPAAGMEGIYSLPAGLAWMEAKNGLISSVDEDSFTIELSYEGEQRALLKVFATASGSFQVKWTPLDDGPAIAFMRLRWRSDPKEGFYGLGNWHD